MNGIPQYPWHEGDHLHASALNAAIANGPYLNNFGINNVLDFGAVGDGVADDTAAINSAIAAGRPLYMPSGTYRVTNALNITTMGQRIYGAGAANTLIRVPATFNMAALGVFSINCFSGSDINSIPGPAIEDLTIEFDQVDTNVKASLIHFPPAIYIRSTLRWRIQRVRIMRGWDGIYAYDNISTGPGVGGGYIDNLMGGCLNTNIYIDGSTDTLRINNPHIWPFGCTSNQQQIFFNPATTVGIQIARADDFHITNGLFYIGLGIRLTSSANGASYGTISDIDFDSQSGIEVVAGSVTLSSCLFLVGASRVGLALLGTATVTASAVSFSAQSPGAVAVECFPPAGSNATLVLGDFVIGLGGTNPNTPAININSNASPGTSLVTLSNARLDVDPTVARAAAVVLCQSNSVTLVMSGCQISPKAAGGPSGLFVQITGGGTGHRITGNSSPGWPNTIPIGCASDYPNFYQQSGGAADLNTVPVPWTGFGVRNYVAPSSQTNWPPNTGPSLAVLDTYTANTSWGVQLSFGFNTDGLWHRWQNAGAWQPWQQVVTTYGGMRMHGLLDFDNAMGVRLFDTVGNAAVSLLLSAGNVLIFNGISASGGVRNIANMTQLSDTSPWQFTAPVQHIGTVGFNNAAPIAKPTVTGAKGGNAALASLLAALAAYGLLIDSTT